MNAIPPTEAQLMEQFQHVIIDGRMYRKVEIKAADIRESSKHLSAQRQISAYAQRVARREARKRRP
jgi:hypothetical protein